MPVIECNNPPANIFERIDWSMHDKEMPVEGVDINGDRFVYDRGVGERGSYYTVVHYPQHGDVEVKRYFEDGTSEMLKLDSE